MMLFAGLAGAVVVAGAAGATVWSRRHRARRDLEVHFQQEWQDQPRWADLGDEKNTLDLGEPSPGSA